MAGMDIEAVERLADETNDLYQLTITRWNDVWKEFLAVDWTGPDRDRFAQGWGATHPNPTIGMPTLDLEGTLRRNAKEQRETSER